METNQAILWKSYKHNQDNYLRDRLIASYRNFFSIVFIKLSDINIKQ